MVKLVHRLHQEAPRVVELEVELHYGCPGTNHKSPKVMKLVMEFHYGNPKMVKLEVKFYQGCYIREHEVSWGGEASDRASPPKMQEGEVHDGTSPWEFQRV